LESILRVTLRPAVESDGPLLFKWANSPDCLAGKLQTSEPIPRDVHDRWFRTRLASGTCWIWILEVNAHPCGQLRVELKGGFYELDIYVVPEFRRHGIAACAIREALRHLACAISGEEIVARVRPANHPSKRLFQSVGFSHSETERDHIVFRLSVGSGGTP